MAVHSAAGRDFGTEGAPLEEIYRRAARPWAWSVQPVCGPADQRTPAYGHEPVVSRGEYCSRSSSRANACRASRSRPALGCIEAAPVFAPLQTQSQIKRPRLSWLRHRHFLSRPIPRSSAQPCSLSGAVSLRHSTIPDLKHIPSTARIVAIQTNNFGNLPNGDKEGCL